MLIVDTFPYPWKQTTGNEFIPCSIGVWHFLKRFQSFKPPVVPFILPESSHKLSVARSHRSGKESRRHRDRSVIVIVTSPMTLLYLYISRRWRQTLNMCLYFTVISQSEARVSAELGIKLYTQWNKLKTLSVNLFQFSPIILKVGKDDLRKMLSLCISYQTYKYILSCNKCTIRDSNADLASNQYIHAVTWTAMIITSL